IATTAERSDEGWTLDGHKCVVLNAPNADTLLVSARGIGAIGIFRPAPPAPTCGCLFTPPSTPRAAGSIHAH
ncbi:MAG: hypothetical protein IPM40_19870, partial [Gammaproteobacteria bacterium]|nr:hypothetical protein [Gammaproteobacteria bacterium]